MADQDVNLTFSLLLKESQAQAAVANLQQQFGAQFAQIGQHAAAASTVAAAGTNRINAAARGAAASVLTLGKNSQASTGQLSTLGRMGSVALGAVDRQLQIISFRSGIVVAGTIALGRAFVRIASEARNFGSGAEAASKAAEVAASAFDKIAKKDHADRVGSLVSGYGHFVRRLKEAEAGAGGASRAFTKLGIDTTQALQNPAVAFQHFVARLAGIQNGAQRAQTAALGLGRGAAAAMPQINGLASGLTATTSASAGLIASLGALVGVVAAVVAVVAVAAIAYAGFLALSYKLADSATKWGDEIYKAAQKANLSVETMSALKVAAEEANVPFDGVGRAMGRLQAKMVTAATDTKSEVARAFRAIGFEGDRLAQAIKNPDKGVRDFIDTFNKMRPTAERSAVAVKAIGEDVHNLIPILNQARGGFDQLEARTRALGLMFSGQAAKDAHAFQMQIRQIRLIGMGLAVSFGTVIAPTVLRALQGIAQMMEALRPTVRALGVAVAQHFQQTILYTKLLLVTMKDAWESFQAWLRIWASSGAVMEQFAKTAVSAFSTMALAASGNFGAAGVALAQTFKDAENLSATAAKIVSMNFKLAVENTRAFARDLFKEVKPPEDAPEGDVETEFPSKPDRSAENELAAAQRRRLKELELAAQEAERVYQRETEEARRNYEQRKTDLDAYVKAQLEAEGKLLAARKAVYEAEKDVVNASVFKESERSLKIAEIEDKIKAAVHENEQAKIRIQDEAQRARYQSAVKHYDSLNQIADTQDQAAIERLRESAEQRAVTYEKAEAAIGDIEEKGFRRRIEHLQALRRVEGISREEFETIGRQIKEVEAEMGEAAANSTRKRASSRQKDLKAAEEWSDEMRRIADEIVEIELDMAERRLQNAPELQRNRGQRARDSSENEGRRELERNRRRNAEIAAERAEAIRKAGRDQAKVEQANKEHNRRVAQEQRRHDAEMVRIRRRQEQQEQRQRPLSRRSLFGDQIADAMEGMQGRLKKVAAGAYEIFANMSEAAGNFGTHIASAFEMAGQAAAQTLATWIMTGETGPAVMRKMAADILSALAQMWMVKGVAQLAEGFAALFFNPAEAAGHFKSAGLYFAAAGLAGVVGRSAAGDLFKSQPAGGAGGGSARGAGSSRGDNSKGDKIVYERGRDRVREKVVTVELAPGLIGREVERDYHGNGKTRKLMNRNYNRRGRG